MHSFESLRLLPSKTKPVGGDYCWQWSVEKINALWRGARGNGDLVQGVIHGGLSCGGNRKGLSHREASFVSPRCARGGRAASGSSCAASTCRTVYLLRGVISLRSSPECQGGVPSSAPNALARTLHCLPPTLYRACRPQFLPYAVNRALTDWQPRGDAAR